MKILLSASEMNPLARTGGLADVLEAFPAALARRGHEVSVVLPCFRGLRTDSAWGFRPTGVSFSIPLGPTQETAEILEGTAPNGVQVFLVRHDAFFDRAALYGENGGAYPDNAARFIFFSKAIVELARRILPAPEILHVHDWQTALVPALVRERRLPFKTVLTIHNLAYQGDFWGVDFGLTNLPGHFFSGQGVEFYGRLNLLKSGIVLADSVTTVSARYAQEIQTPEYGFGLDAVLRENATKLFGILNGWEEPAATGLVEKKETARRGRASEKASAERLGTSQTGKSAQREALLAELQLAPNPQGPVFAVVSRLAEQKGLDLLLPLLDRLLADDVRLVLLGEGEPAYERELLIASKRHPERFAFQKKWDDRLAHLIHAGADAFLLPSHFEPCGLSAMAALKHGTLPIARATGGLAEIIRDFDPADRSGYGFLFYEYRVEAFWDAILRARALFAQPDLWQTLLQRAIALDFSWDRAVEKYEAIYARGQRRGGGTR